MAKRTVLVGDAHGRWGELFGISRMWPTKPHLVIGDIGLGFARHKDPDEFPANLWGFRGNHDNPLVCKDHPKVIPDVGMWRGMFIVAGADSIDKADRVSGLSWWPDEQLNREQMELAIEEYEKAKPRIMVTHEAPWRLHKVLADVARLRDPGTERWGEPRGNSTAFALDDMLRIHQPEYWYFGHWHCSFRLRLHGTIFRCLDILETEEVVI